jgi:hypothetical protein
VHCTKRCCWCQEERTAKREDWTQSTCSDCLDVQSDLYDISFKF